MFIISEKTGVPFQIHYEIEDELLAPLENMLQQHPKAKVIWCHFAQIRYIERASRYSPAYVDSLIKHFPNLYFDTAYPKQFLSALDLRGNRMERISEWDQNHRNFLKRLPSETQHQVAYQSAWTLLFGEEFA